MQHCFGLLPIGSTSPLHPARFARRSRKSIERRRRQLAGQQPAAEVFETRVMLSAVVIELNIEPTSIQQSDSGLPPFQVSTFDSLQIVDGSSVFDVTYRFTLADLPLGNGESPGDLIESNGWLQPVADDSEFPGAERVGRFSVMHLQSILAAAPNVAGFFDTASSTAIVDGSLSRASTELSTLESIVGQQNAMLNQSPIDAGEVAGELFAADIQRDLDTYASNLSTDFTPEVEAVENHFDSTFVGPVFEPSSPVLKPEVYVQFETSTPGLLESEAGRKVEQALIRHLQPIVQSKAFRGLFHSSVASQSAVSSAVSSVSGFANQLSISQTDRASSTFTVKGIKAEVVDPFITANVDSSSREQQSDAISQLIASDQYSPLDFEQLVSQTSTITASNSLFVDIVDAVIWPSTAQTSTIRQAVLPAISTTLTSSVDRIRTANQVSFTQTSAPQVSQHSVSDLMDPWLALLVDRPQNEDQTSNAGNVSASSTSNFIRVVSSEPQFVIASDSSGIEQSRKGLVTFDPQTSQIDADVDVQSENDRPEERRVQFTNLKHNPYEQSPRGPPANQTIDSEFDLNRASQLRLQLLRHSQAPRSPSTVSVG